MTVTDTEKIIPDVGIFAKSFRFKAVVIPKVNPSSLVKKHMREFELPAMLATKARISSF
jgi:hypothetical protein